MTISPRTREALFVHAEGRSKLSGDPLGPTWEVDHKTPRAAGGTDDILNLQAANADENRAKSMANPPDPLDWQAEFIDKWRRELVSSFLLVALPGSGKTIAALFAAKEWIEQDPARRKVVIIVPTDPLRDQWQGEAAALFGMQFQARDFAKWKPGMNGFVLTYQGLAGHAALWQLRCHDYELLVICDEIHHAGPNDWGGQLRECFSKAARRLVMSGTPFRSDNTRIPFVDYDSEGQCVAHHRYDYPRAIREGVIRIVRFQHERGIVRRLTALGEDCLELSNESVQTQADEALRRILRPGKYTEELLRLAHTQLLRCRESMPRAGALALCIDQDHAQQVAQQLRAVTGIEPAVIVSDDERATSSVEAFRESDRMWVVAVRQVSEGVDIKRLMVLAYLTTARTSLFFRQAVGRIVRTLGTPEDMESYCFIPDHPTLVRHAQLIISAQVQALEDEDDEEFERSIRREQQPPLFPDVILGTEHTGTAGTIIEGETLPPAIAAEVAALAREIGIPECKALLVWKKYRATSAPPSAGGEMRSPQRPLEKQLDDASKVVDRAVKRFAQRLLPTDDDRFRKLNSYINKFIGKWDRRTFTLEESWRAVDHLKTLKPGDV